MLNKKTYPLGDRHPAQKSYLDDSIKAINTKEYRNPKKGDWFLSGAEVTAYKAPNDLSCKYYIAKIVKIETITTQKVVQTF